MPLFLAVVMALSTATAATPPPKASAPPAAEAVPVWAEDDAEPPPTPEQRAEKAAYLSYTRSLLKSLRASSRPRDRAIATQMGWMPAMMEGRMPSPAEQAADGAILRAAAEAAPDDALLQRLWSQASPEASGCDARRPCPERSRALVRLQPDNAVAWMPTVEAAWKARDVAATDAALAQMARATMFDDYTGEAIKAWVDVYRRYPAPAPPAGSAEAAAGRGVAGFSQAMAYAAATETPAFGSVAQACHHDWHPDAPPSRFHDCAQVGRVLLTRSHTLLARQMGRALLRISGQATPGDVAAARTVAWQYEQWGRLIERLDDPARMKGFMADWLATGDELAVLERQFARDGIPLIPPAGWQPRGRDGKPIGPLGEAPATTKKP